MTRSKMHGAVAVLFVLAILCYVSLWLDAALIFGLIGVVIEITAWLTWIATDRNDANVD